MTWLSFFRTVWICRSNIKNKDHCTSWDLEVMSSWNSSLWRNKLIDDTTFQPSKCQQKWSVKYTWAICQKWNDISQNCLSISICGVGFNCKLFAPRCVKNQKKVIPGNNKDQKFLYWRLLFTLSKLKISIKFL